MFTITTPAQLAGLAELVNSGDNDNGITFDGKTITLANDIDLASKDWRPIGFHVSYYGSSVSRPFSGAFDGEGYDIVNLFISEDVGNLGLFALVSGDTATVKNLNVSGSVLRTGTVSAVGNFIAVGGVVAYNNGVVEKCSFFGQVQSVEEFVGGIIGRNRGHIRDSSNYSSVYGDGWVGGVVGWISQYTTIANCSNFGRVEGTGAATGGVIGLHSGTAENCLNAGNVSNGYAVGGVVGYNEVGIITNCYNMGNIATEGDYIVVGSVLKGMAGGIVGSGSTSVANCSNVGTVSGDNIVGGIIGRTEGCAVINCSNTGKVSYVGNGSMVGGLVGYNYGGDISTSEYAKLTADRAIGLSRSGTISPDVVSVDLNDINIVGVIVRPSNFKIDGNPVTLTAFVHPMSAQASKKTVTWKSGDTSVATVTANGAVSGNSAGKTKITVTTDEKVLGGFIASADASVEVIGTSPTPPVDGGGGGGCNTGLFSAFAFISALPFVLRRKQ